MPSAVATLAVACLGAGVFRLGSEGGRMFVVSPEAVPAALSWAVALLVAAGAFAYAVLIAMPRQGRLEQAANVLERVLPGLEDHLAQIEIHQQLTELFGLHHGGIFP